MKPKYPCNITKQTVPFILVIVVALVEFGFVATAWPIANGALPDHPRLIVLPDTLPQAKARLSSGIRQKAWQEVISRANVLLKGDDPSFHKAFELACRIDLSSKAREPKGEYEVYFRDLYKNTALYGLLYLFDHNHEAGRAAISAILKPAKELDPEKFEGYFYTRSFWVRAAALIYDWCHPLLEPEEKQLLQKTIVAWCRILYRESLTGHWAQAQLFQIWNWNPGIAASLGLGCLAVLDETPDPARAWLFQATRWVENYWNMAVGPEGGAIEGPWYLDYGAGSSPLFFESLRHLTGEDLWTKTHYPAFLRFLPNEVLPGGRGLINIGDSRNDMNGWTVPVYAMHRSTDRGHALGLFQSMADSPKSWGAADLLPLVLWGEDGEAIPPERWSESLPKYAHAPWRGLSVSRTGWGPMDVFFSIHAQQWTGSKHDQADKGHLNLTAYGTDLLIDSGYGADKKLEGSGGPLAHNGVLLDGKGQAWARPAAHTSGYLRESLGSGACDVSRVDLKDAFEFSFNSAYWNQGEDFTRRPARNMVRAVRHALFVRGAMPYVLVYDDIQQDDRQREYTLLLHTRDGNRVTTRTNGFEIRPVETNRNAGGALVWLSANGTPDFAVDSYQTTKEGSHPRLTAKVRSTAPEFFNLILPFPAALGPNGAETMVSPGPRPSEYTVRQDGGIQDRMARRSAGSILLEGFESDGALLWIRLDGKGQLLAWAGTAMTRLRLGSRTLFAAGGSPMTVLFADGKVQVSGPHVESIAMDARIPVILNGLAVPGPEYGQPWKPDGATARIYGHRYVGGQFY